jgi:FAD:protein FMN transferase
MGEATARHGGHRVATIITLARPAMGTRFELVLCGDDSVFLRAAGEEALDEVERLEAQLSFYRPDSELSGINARAAVAPVVVEPRFFGLLERIARLSAATEGAFDPTVAPLMRCWGFVGGTGRPPDPDALAEARRRVGMRHVVLDPAARTIRFLQPGMSLDLGAVGKGYAVERAAELLRATGVTAALLHAGTSTVAALGAPPECSRPGDERRPPPADAWTVAIRRPVPPGAPAVDEQAVPSPHLALARLRDRALSVSATHGKSFTLDGRRFGHVIDPRTGQPVHGALLAALITDSPTDGDALSTALLTLGAAGVPLLQRHDPHARGLVALEAADSGEPMIMLLGDPADELVYPAHAPSASQRAGFWPEEG